MPRKVGSILNIAKLSKLQKIPGRRAGIFQGLRNALFDLDFYSYTPSLISTEFSTWVSLTASLAVGSLFLFCIAYLLFLWLSTPFNISEGEVEHDFATTLVPLEELSRGGKSTLALPIAGVVLSLGNGTSLLDPAFVKIQWQQATICSGANSAKLEDDIPGKTCSFYSTEDGRLRSSDTNCAAWGDARSVLEAANNTATNPCQTHLHEGQPYLAPRISGTFYAPEYSYITATVSVAVDPIWNSTDFNKNLYKGAVSLYLQYPYTGTKSLLDGSWPDGQQVVWSRRVNLLANTTMKWETALRTRSVQAASYWWDIPQLSKEALDFKVQYTEVSMATAVPKDGWLDVAKVYIKLDDRDMQVSMSPYTTLFQLFSDSGGFLSILMALGLPAMLYNYNVFRNTVASLITKGDITFDEAMRKRRSMAIHTSFCANKSAGALDPPDQPSVTRSGASLTSLTGGGAGGTKGGLQKDGSSDIAAMLASPAQRGAHMAQLQQQLGAGRPNGGHPRAGSGSGDGAHSGGSGSRQGSALHKIGSGLKALNHSARVVPLPVLPPPEAWAAGDAAGGQEAGAGPAAAAVPAAAAAAEGRVSGSASGSSAAAAAAPAGPVAEGQEAHATGEVSQQQQQQRQAADSAATNQGEEQAGGHSSHRASPLSSAGEGAGAGQEAGAGLHVEQPGSGMELPGAPLHSRPPRHPPTRGDSRTGILRTGSGRSNDEDAAGKPAVRRKSIGLRWNESETGEALQLQLQGSARADARVQGAAASILVSYQADIFQDSDEETNDFDDVVRHCTSECHALYHLRQVVKLVQHERHWLTCGLEGQGAEVPKEGPPAV